MNDNNDKSQNMVREPLKQSDSRLLRHRSMHEPDPAIDLAPTGGMAEWIERLKEIPDETTSAPLTPELIADIFPGITVDIPECWSGVHYKPKYPYPYRFGTKHFDRLPARLRKRLVSVKCYPIHTTSGGLTRQELLKCRKLIDTDFRILPPELATASEVLSKFSKHLKRFMRKHESHGLNYHPAYPGIWVNYNGWRLKDPHDIMLHDGTIIKECYPNAKAWSLDASQELYPEGTRYSYDDSEVKMIRLLPDDEITTWRCKGEPRMERNVDYFGNAFPKVILGKAGNPIAFIPRSKPGKSAFDVFNEAVPNANEQDMLDYLKGAYIGGRNGK